MIYILLQEVFLRQFHFSFLKNYQLKFGGELLSGKRKTARPLSTKRPIHLVLKSTGNSFFNPGNRHLEKIFREQAQKYSITIYHLSLNWSHVHCLLKLPTRASYLAFIRTVTAALMAFLSKQKGKSLKGLFDLRPFTRILNWGRDFKNALAYSELNDQEAWGLLDRKKKPAKKRKESKSS